MLASQQGSVVRGMSLLLIYSLGLGLPFLASAVLIEQLKGAFGFIKKHYRVINLLSGGLLIIVGILMMTGHFSRFLLLLSF
jgi:cytochrome c-type biogenesis protein